MKYLDFIIRDYKAISGELVIDVSKKTLLPIIGTNESGKTSILWALFAFDENNDSLNEGRHLRNVENLYKTTSTEPVVYGRIEINKDELLDVLDRWEDTPEDPLNEEMKKSLAGFKRLLKKEWNNVLLIKRNLKTKRYTIENPELQKFTEINSLVAAEVISDMPFILYFDDFRDLVQEQIEIAENSGSANNSWLTIIEQLFKKTNPEYSVFKLKDLEELRRESVLADVCKVLNKTLAKEWEKFTLEEGSVLDVEIKYIIEGERNYLKLYIKEKVEGSDRYFGIQDRSKGFYWFFNFVMKLEFNPKVRSLEDRDTIYLLDEPGSYLHSSAQAKLCEKLASLSKNNVVVYCTHSHYLLDPDTIPLNYIKIAKKNKDGSVSLKSLPDYTEDRHEKRTALQPIIDALKIKPFITDFNFNEICITEGIYDYYVFEMFKPKDFTIKFLPSVNAQSIPFFISISIAWRLKYVALWDNDEEGKKELAKATEFFGEKESEKFMTLPVQGRKKTTILQDLFDGQDFNLIKETLEIPKNSSFTRTILLLYFSDKRNEVIAKISDKTKTQIEAVLNDIKNRIR